MTILCCVDDNVFLNISDINFTSKGTGYSSFSAFHSVSRTVECVSKYTLSRLKTKSTSAHAPNASFRTHGLVFKLPSRSHICAAVLTSTSYSRSLHKNGLHADPPDNENYITQMAKIYFGIYCHKFLVFLKNTIYSPHILILQLLSLPHSLACFSMSVLRKKV